MKPYVKQLQSKVKSLGYKSVPVFMRKHKLNDANWYYWNSKNTEPSAPLKSKINNIIANLENTLPTNKVIDAKPASQEVAMPTKESLQMLLRQELPKLIQKQKVVAGLQSLIATM